MLTSGVTSENPVSSHFTPSRGDGTPNANAPLRRWLEVPNGGGIFIENYDIIQSDCSSQARNDRLRQRRRKQQRRGEITVASSPFHSIHATVTIELRCGVCVVDVRYPTHDELIAESPPGRRRQIPKAQPSRSSVDRFRAAATSERLDDVLDIDAALAELARPILRRPNWSSSATSRG